MSNKKIVLLDGSRSGDEETHTKKGDEMNRKDSSKFGSVAAFLAGIALFVGGASTLPYQYNILFGGCSSCGWQYWHYVWQNPGMLEFTGATFAVWSLLTLAVVLAFAEYLQVGDGLLIRWVSLLALIGLAVNAASYLYAVNETLSRATMIALYGEGSVGATLTRGLSAGTLDPYSLLGFGLLGFWLVVVNWFARHQDRFPEGLAWVGILAGIACCLEVAVQMFGIYLFGPTLDILARVPQLAAVILGPLWLIWLGVVLLRAPTSLMESEQDQTPLLSAATP